MRFVAAEWRAADFEEAMRLWSDARAAYARQHPGGALGDELEELRGRVAERRRLWGL